MGGATRRIYPKANATAQWWETTFARTSFTRIDKILLHTTETTSWPGYKSGASAPTLTYHPRLRAWRQHNYVDRSARALVDPDSTPVRENRDNVIQIEIIAYADEKIAGSVGGLPVSALSDGALKDLGDFIGWVHQQWGGPPLVAARFIAYPGSYGSSSVRMSSAQYDAFRGVLGHQHASGNAHGDPGALNVPRIMQHAAAYVSGTTPTSPQEDDMQLTDKLPNGLTVGQALGRGAWAYDQVVSTGSIAKRLANEEATSAGLREALAEVGAASSMTAAQIEAVIDAKVTAKLDNLKVVDVDDPAPAG